jgi:2-(1,2-epoxy-1,2-dihydrophenyl)acetyl-CoA isomerase
VNDPLLLEIRDGGARVTFNRPEVRNALTPDMLHELGDFLTEVQADPGVRYLLLGGTGEHFSAGGDIAIYRDTLRMTPMQRRIAFERRVLGNTDVISRLDALSIPIISLIKGAVAGAGLSFVLLSDFVYGSEDSFLLFAQPKIGLPLDLGLTHFLPRVVGIKAATRLAMTGARLSATEAQTLGIVDLIAPAGELEARAITLIEKMATVAPRGAGRSKRLLRESGYRSLTEQMSAEVKAIGDCVTEPDFSEGVMAFLEKRAPKFRG